jgi:hypothetical protein
MECDSRMENEKTISNGSPYSGKRWRTWIAVRNVITFFLGVSVILDSLVEKNTATVGKLVVGLLLIGVPTIEDIIRITKRRG